MPANMARRQASSMVHCENPMRYTGSCTPGVQAAKSSNSGSINTGQRTNRRANQGGVPMNFIRNRLKKLHPWAANWAYDRAKASRCNG
ncbi:MAG: hypothetical protein NVS3B25_02530 [Hymenobacter sp.]